VPQSVRRTLLDPLLLASAPARVQKYVRLSQLPLEHRYLGVSLYATENATRLYTPEYARHAPVVAPWRALETHYERTADADPLTRMLHTDLKTWLVDDLLIKADKMTMANSVELRVPFLDHRVVEYAATVPSSMKLRNGTGKWILKEAMRGVLPDTTLKRRKVGFPTPLTLMFRKDLSGYLRDLLLSSRSRQRGMFRTDRIEQLIAEHRSGQRDHQKLLWQLVVLEEWQRRFIDPSIGSHQHLASVAAAT
jgi:asparagine synthase (glutamine-hydrolysing)